MVRIEWKRPALGFANLNFDESCMGKLGILGVRGILKDQGGILLFTVVWQVGICCCRGFLEGLKELELLGIRRVEMEGDSRVVIV